MATITEVAPIEADDSACNSGYESSHAGSSTGSMTSSLHKYLEENGRRYHSYYGEDKNYMPADDEEKARLNIQHESFRIIAGGVIHKAPVKNAQRVLDLGTGTGIWCVDFADENPQAEVTGVDLSPIQPVWVPPNCKFETDDLELDWTYKDDTYDFVHSRNVTGTISDVEKYVKQMYRCTKPGGYAELTELEGILSSDDNSIPADWPPSKPVRLIVEAVEKLGKKFLTGDQIAKLLSDAGFVDVVVTPLKVPFGNWPKDPKMKQAGILQLYNAETMYHSYGMALFTRVLGMTVEEAQKICDDARHATLYRARKEKVHHWTRINLVYGRKPEKDE